MFSILFVGEDTCLAQSCALWLNAAGHAVETATNIFRARDRLCGEACDVAVIDVRSPDGGMGLLIEQARAAWPGCRVIALVPPAGFSRSKVHEMGLWTPDSVLVHPIGEAALVSAIADLAPGGDAKETPVPSGTLQ